MIAPYAVVRQFQDPCDGHAPDWEVMRGAAPPVFAPEPCRETSDLSRGGPASCDPALLTSVFWAQISSRRWELTNRRPSSCDADELASSWEPLGNRPDRVLLRFSGVVVRVADLPRPAMKPISSSVVVSARVYSSSDFVRKRFTSSLGESHGNTVVLRGSRYPRNVALDSPPGQPG